MRTKRRGAGIQATPRPRAASTDACGHAHTCILHDMAQAHSERWALCLQTGVKAATHSQWQTNTPAVGMAWAPSGSRRAWRLKKTLQQGSGGGMQRAGFLQDRSTQPAPANCLIPPKNNPKLPKQTEGCTHPPGHACTRHRAQCPRHPALPLQSSPRACEKPVVLALQGRWHRATASTSSKASGLQALKPYPATQV